MSKNTIFWDSVRTEVLATPAVKAEYNALESEFSIASQVIALRATTGLTQREFAERLGMKQPQLARIESGKQIPKLETLAKLAAAAGYKIEVGFIPLKGKNIPKVKPLKINWPSADGEIMPSVLVTVTRFLASNDPVAVRVQKRLGEQSIFKTAAELEKCLSVSGQYDQLFAIKDILLSSGFNKRLVATRDDINDEMELLELAEDLMNKLAEILNKS